MLSPGDIVDRYHVEEEIGRGGMAVVYRVRHTTLGSTHALKVLFVQSPGLRERAVQEGRLQAGIRHPNVVAVTDVVTVGGAPGLIMDYVAGPNLEEWLANRVLPIDQAISLFRDILLGVAAAHERGYVHRDLKPSNVLVATRDGRIVPEITDFGIAKVIDDELGGVHATRSNVSMGTPSYMAPEQIRDARSVDARADVFSLGCILYRMLCGRPPFVGDDVLTIMSATAAGNYPNPRELRADIPDNLVDLINRSLTPQPADRLRSCAELLVMLDGGPPPERLPTLPPVGTPSPNATFFTGDDTLAPDLAPAAPSLPSLAPDSLSTGAGPTTGGLPLVDTALPVVGSQNGRLIQGTLAAVIAVGAILWVILGRDADQPVVAPAPVEQLAASPTEVPVAAPVTAPVAAPTPTEPAAVAQTTNPEAAPSDGPAKPAAAPARPPRSTPKTTSTEVAPPPPVTPPPADTASVALAGDADTVWLVSSTGERTQLGARTSIPAGRYTVRASFPGLGEVSAGQLSVAAGESVRLSCSAAFSRCAR